MESIQSVATSVDGEPLWTINKEDGALLPFLLAADGTILINGAVING